MSKKPLYCAIAFLLAVFLWLAFILLGAGDETPFSIESAADPPPEFRTESARRDAATAGREDSPGSAIADPARADVVGGKSAVGEEARADDWFEIQVLDEEGVPAAAARVQIAEAWFFRGGRLRSTQERVRLMQCEGVMDGVADAAGLFRIRRRRLPQHFAIAATAPGLARVVRGDADAAGTKRPSRQQIILAPCTRLRCHLKAGLRFLNEAQIHLSYSLADDDNDSDSQPSRLAFFSYPVLAGEELELPPKGTLRSARSPGFLPWKGEIALEEGATEVELQFAEAQRLRIAFTGVEAKHADERARLMVLTGTAGTRTLSLRLGDEVEIEIDPQRPTFGLSLDSRRYRLFEEVNSWGRQASFRLSDAIEGRLEVKLVRAPVIEGRVIGEGRPLAGISLVLIPSSARGGLINESSMTRVLSDEEGRYRFDGVVLGQAYILVDAVDWTPRQVIETPLKCELALRQNCLPGHRVERDIELVRSAKAEFRLLNEKGQAVDDFSVTMIEPRPVMLTLVPDFTPQLAQAWHGPPEPGLLPCASPGAQSAGSGSVLVTAIPHFAQATFRVRYRHPETSRLEYQDIEVPLEPGERSDVEVRINQSARYAITARVRLDGVVPQRPVQAQLMDSDRKVLDRVEVVNGLAVIPQIQPGLYFLRFSAEGAEKVLDAAEDSQLFVRDRNLEFERELYCAEKKEFVIEAPAGDWGNWKARVGVVLSDRIGLGQQYRAEVWATLKASTWSFRALVPDICDARVDRVTLSGPRPAPRESPAHRVFLPRHPDAIIEEGQTIILRDE
jgi:hypothetical protein